MTQKHKTPNLKMNKPVILTLDWDFQIWRYKCALPNNVASGPQKDKDTAGLDSWPLRSDPVLSVSTGHSTTLLPTFKHFL